MLVGFADSDSEQVLVGFADSDFDQVLVVTAILDQSAHRHPILQPLREVVGGQQVVASVAGRVLVLVLDPRTEVVVVGGRLLVPRTAVEVVAGRRLVPQTAVEEAPTPRRQSRFGHG